MRRDLKDFKRQTGQTMIETLVAIFILTMGISAAMGLAIYAYSASSSSSKQIIAIGLAREGLEAVRNMRDTDWLKSAPINTNCYDFGNNKTDLKCYTNWWNPTGSGNPDNGSGYNLSVNASPNKYRLIFDPVVADKYWSFVAGINNWGLDFDTHTLATNPAAFKGFYTINNIASGVQTSTSGFYRKIVITGITSQPFSFGANDELQVDAYVWWIDKKCPAAADYPAANPACRLDLQTYLTNWKNY